MINIHTPYTPLSSSERIDGYLKKDKAFLTPLFAIPQKSDLVTKDLANIVLSGMCVHFEIKNDSDQQEGLHKSTIIKILFSEIGRVLYDSTYCFDIEAFGNNIWGIFNTPMQSGLNSLIETSAKVSSAFDLMNAKIKDSNCHIEFGIGIDYGTASYVTDQISVVKDQTNYAWMGDTLESMYRISSLMTYKNGVMKSNGERRPIGITKIVYQNLKRDYQAFFTEDSNFKCYRAGLLNVEINNWIKENLNK